MQFQKMYAILVDGAEKAIAAMEEQNYGLAREFLIRAEREAEELYLGEEEEKEQGMETTDPFNED